jgi:chromosome segregation ATPase
MADDLTKSKQQQIEEIQRERAVLLEQIRSSQETIARSQELLARIDEMLEKLDGSQKTLQ